MITSFSTRCLKMSYKFKAYGQDQIDSCKTSLNDILFQLFNTGYRLGKSSCLLYVPVDSNYINIVITLNNEFRKQPLLKGMQFRVDLWERMREV